MTKRQLNRTVMITFVAVFATMGLDVFRRHIFMTDEKSIRVLFLSVEFLLIVLLHVINILVMERERSNILETELNKHLYDDLEEFHK